MALFTGAAMAATWTGMLVDDTCMNQHNSANQQQQQKSNETLEQQASACTPTDATSNFALIANGKAFMLNPAGNQKAQSALKSRAERSANANQPNNNPQPVRAKVTGTLQGNTIETQSLTLR